MVSYFYSFINWFSLNSDGLIQWSVYALLALCLLLWLSLRRKDRWFRNVIEHSPSAIALIDPNSLNIVYSNLTLHKLFSLSRQGRYFQFHRPQFDELLDQLLMYKSRGEVSPISLEIDCLSGPVLVEVHARIISFQRKQTWLCFINDLSQMNSMELSLSRKQKLFSDVMSAIPEQISCIDREGFIIGCNDSWAKSYGMKAVDLMGKSEADFIPAKDLDLRLSQRAPVWRGDSCNNRHWHETPNGAQRMLQENQYPLQDERGIYGVLSVAQDVTDWQRLNKKLETENQQRKVTEAELASQNSLIRTVFRASPDPIAFIDDQGRFSGSNVHFSCLYGLTSEEVTGMQVNEVIPNETVDVFLAQDKEVLNNNRTIRYEEMILDVGDDMLWFEVLKAPYQDDSSGARGIFLIMRDITERKATEEKLAAAVKELETLSYVDGLTRIANRRSFDIRARRLWKALAPEKQSLALILCDIDFFKAYNDNYGHLKGDDALVQVASVLSHEIMREADLVARYGGEEFAILLPNTSLDGACILAEKLLKAIDKMNVCHEFSAAGPRLTISLGLATLIPSKDNKPTHLIQLADDALYKAKAAGKNCYYRSDDSPETISENKAFDLAMLELAVS